MLADLRMPGMDGVTLLGRLPAAVPAIVITGLDVEPPPRAAALLHKDELTRDRLAFTDPQHLPGNVMTEPAAVLLLVDDDEAKRYVLATWLKRAGHTVIEVGTGHEALDQAETADMVLLDVNLPDMSGFDVCRQHQVGPADGSHPGDPGVRDRRGGGRPGAWPDPGCRRLPDRADRASGAAGRR